MPVRQIAIRFAVSQTRSRSSKRLTPVNAGCIGVCQGYAETFLPHVSSSSHTIVLKCRS